MCLDMPMPKVNLARADSWDGYIREREDSTVFIERMKEGKAEYRYVCIRMNDMNTNPPPMFHMIGGYDIGNERFESLSYRRYKTSDGWNVYMYDETQKRWVWSLVSNTETNDLQPDEEKHMAKVLTEAIKETMFDCYKVPENGSGNRVNIGMARKAFPKGVFPNY